MEQQVDNETPFAREIAAALQSQPVTWTPECLEPEELLALAKHDGDGPVPPRLAHVARCAYCRRQYIEMLETWRLAVKARQHERVSSTPQSEEALDRKAAPPYPTVLPLRTRSWLPRFASDLEWENGTATGAGKSWLARLWSLFRSPWFPRDWERAFQEDYFQKNFLHVRRVALLMFLVASFFGSVKLGGTPKVRPELFGHLYRLLCGSLFLLYLFSFTPHFRRFMQHALGFVALIAGGILLVMTYQPAQDQNGFIALVLMIMCTYTLARLQFFAALAACLTITAAYVWMSVALLPTPSGQLVHNTINLLLANLCGGVAGYSMEAHLRREFKLRRREAEFGARIQQTLLQGQPPRFVAGARVAAITIPSQRMDGDFYDFFPLGARCLDVVIGDVQGKGIPAALVGAALKSEFLRAMGQLIAFGGDGHLPEPEQIVGRVHEEVTGQLIELERFVTLCYARLDGERREAVLVDCGHPKTIHYQQRTGACAQVNGNTMVPLGVSEGEIYRQVSRPFDPGDLFFFYSDGVPETRNAAGEFFGVERLTELIQTSGHLEPEAVIERVVGAVSAFSRREIFADDLTCVAVRVAQDAGEIGSPASSEALAEPRARGTQAAT